MELSLSELVSFVAVPYFWRGRPFWCQCGRDKHQEHKQQFYSEYTQLYSEYTALQWVYSFTVSI